MISIGSNGAIIMFDMTSIDSYNHVNKYYTSISKLCENTPICLVGNKIDDRSRRRVQEKQIVFHRQKLVGLFLVSTKTNENIEKPFEWLLRQINNDDTITLVEPPNEPASPLPVQRDRPFNLIREISEQEKEEEKENGPREDRREESNREPIRQAANQTTSVAQSEFYSPRSLSRGPSGLVQQRLRPFGGGDSSLPQ
eukprot:TRINITY_DN1131_c0_g1_i1.p1 TRINITY_DN1131_c0_g1~~TRINITY_DN1131_c0_g1_i1.p1  ORF type:complete len:197 (-),score=53.54 TRINITY_DN1131_c0_g1_i1:111-701(-)